MAGMLASVISGRIVRPAFFLIYGPSGIGKTTYAAQAPFPIFLGAEDGADLLDVARFPRPRTLEDVYLCLKELHEKAHNFKTLVIDSLDWIEPLIFQAICKRYNKTTIVQAAGGYGNGFIEAAEEWLKILQKFSELRDDRGMAIILIAHPEVKTVTNPQTQATYQRYELKLHKLSKAKITEAVDGIFFASFEMFASNVDGTLKTLATSNRVLQGVPDQYDGFDAKNRYGLSEAIPMSLPWAEFIERCNIAPAVSLEEIRDRLDKMLPLITDHAKGEQVSDFMHTHWNDSKMLLGIIDKVKVIIGHQS